MDLLGWGGEGGGIIGSIDHLDFFFGRGVGGRGINNLFFIFLFLLDDTL